MGVISAGGDPYVINRNVPAVAGPATVRVRIKCKTRGTGQVFWTSSQAANFHRSRSVAFELEHDGAWREYEIKLPLQGKMQALRLDPGNGPGKIEIDWIRLIAPDGKPAAAWEFDGGDNARE